jgi:hypothetical protein
MISVSLIFGAGISALVIVIQIIPIKSDLSSDFGKSRHLSTYVRDIRPCPEYASKSVSLAKMIVLLSFVDNAIYAHVAQVFLEPVYHKASTMDN